MWYLLINAYYKELNWSVTHMSATSLSLHAALSSPY